MRGKWLAAIALTTTLLVLGGAGTARAAFTIGGTNYLESGSTESMVSSFLNVDGGISTGTYNGLVKVTISGFGEAEGTSLNDAFYIFTDGSHNPIAPYNDANYYQVAFDTQTLVILNPSRDARNFIRYDVNAGSEVTPTYVPTYRSDHTYTVVLDTGTTNLSNLHFGVSNGIFSDNSGAYNIQITQLVPTPEPFTLSLLGLGLGALGLSRRRKKQNA
jgi:hypothetical protein